MVIKDNENNPLIESAKLIFQSLIDDPDYQATDNQTREEVVMGEAVQRANQSHRNNLALSLGNDLEKLLNFLKAEPSNKEKNELIRTFSTTHKQDIKGKERTVLGFNAGKYLWENHGIRNLEQAKPILDFIVNNNMRGTKAYAGTNEEIDAIVQAVKEGKSTLEGTEVSGASGGTQREETPSSSATTSPPKIEFTTKLTRKLLEDNPDKIYLFGDNVADRGTKKKGGGQAVIRGLPNAFGIPTKHSAKTTDDAYFKDDEASQKIIVDAFRELAEKHPNKTIVIPVNRDGKHTLGKGLAKLEEKAPQTLAILNKILDGITNMEINRQSQEMSSSSTPPSGGTNQTIKQPSREVGSGTDVRLEAQNRVNDILGNAIKNGDLSVMSAVENYRPKGGDNTPQEAMRFFIDPYTQASNLAREVPYDLASSIEPHLTFLRKLQDARDDGLWEGGTPLGEGGVAYDDDDKPYDEEDYFGIGALQSSLAALAQVVAMEGDFSRKLERVSKNGKPINYNNLLYNERNGYFNTFGHNGIQELLANIDSNKLKRPDADTYGIIQNVRISLANNLIDQISNISLPKDQETEEVDADGKPILKTWRTIANQYGGYAETLYGEDAPLRAIPAKLNNYEKAKVLVNQYINRYGLSNALTPPRDTVQFYELQNIQHAYGDWWKLFPRGRNLEPTEEAIPRPVQAAMEVGNPEVARRIMMRYNADPDLYKNPTRQLGGDLVAGNPIKDQLAVLGFQAYEKNPELFHSDWLRRSGKNTVGLPIGDNSEDVYVNMDDLVALLYLVAPEHRKFNHKTDYPRASHSDIQNLELGDEHKEVIDSLNPYIEEIKKLESKFGGIGDIYLYGHGADNIVNNGEQTPHLKLGVRLYALPAANHRDHFDPDAFASDTKKANYKKNIQKLQKDFTAGVNKVLKTVEKDAGIKVQPHVHFSNNPSELVGNRINEREAGEELNYIHFPGDYQFGQIPALDAGTSETTLPFDPYLNGKKSQKQLASLLPAKLFHEEGAVDADGKNISGNLKDEHIKDFKQGNNLSFELATQALSREELIYYLRQPDSQHARKWQDKWNQLHDLEADDAFDDQGNPSSLYARFMMADTEHQDATDVLNRLNSSSYRIPTQELIDGIASLAGDDYIGWTMPDLDPLTNPDLDMEELAQSIIYDAETNMLRITPELIETVSELIGNFGSEGYLPSSRIKDEEATYDFLVKRMRLQNEISERRQHLSDLMGKDTYGHEDPDQLTARNDIVAKEAELKALLEDPSNFNAQGNPINGLAVLTQATDNVHTTRTTTRKAHDDYLYGPLTEAEDGNGNKIQMRRVVGTTELGHKGQEVPQPVEIWVDERRGGREEFLRHEQQDLINLLEGATITGYNEETGEIDPDNEVKLPGLLTELQNTKVDGKPIDSKKSQGFQNLRVDLIWTDPDDPTNKIILGHMIPVNMGEILSKTAARFAQEDEAGSFANFQTLFTPDELANLQYTLLPATVNTQAIGKNAKPVPLLEQFQPASRNILGLEANSVDDTAEEGVGITENHQALIDGVLRMSGIAAVDKDNNPTPEAINLATGVLKANGYSDDTIDAYKTSNRLIKYAKEENADTEDKVLNELSLEYLEDLEDEGVVFDRNAEGDVYVQNKATGEQNVFIDDDNIDDDWGLVKVLKQYQRDVDRSRDIEIESLFEAAPEIYTQSLGTRDQLGTFRYSFGSDVYDRTPSDDLSLELWDNADLDGLQQKIRNGLLKKGLFDLSQEDAATDLLEGILGSLGRQYQGADPIVPFLEGLQPSKLLTELNNNKTLINRLSPEARQYFLTNFLSRAYKTEKYFTERAKRFAPVDKDGKPIQVSETANIINSALDFGQSSGISVRDRAKIYFTQILKEAQEYSNTGVHPHEATMYMPMGHEARQLARESHALRQFRNKVNTRRAEQAGEEVTRIIKPIEIVNTLQWLSEYFLREGRDDQDTFLTQREGHPIQYVVNPETGKYYTTDDPQGDAKLYYETDLRNIITTIREREVEGLLKPADIGEILQEAIQSFTKEGWTSTDPVLQDSIDVISVVDKLSETLSSGVLLGVDRDDDAKYTSPTALSIIKQLALSEAASPLSTQQGMDSDSIEAVLPFDLFSVQGNSTEWISKFKTKFPYYTAIAKSFGYTNVYEWLADENIILEGQQLKNSDVRMLDQKLARWKQGSGRSGASQIHVLTYDGTGTFNVVGRGSGGDTNIQEQLSGSFKRAQEHFDKVTKGEGTWSALINALDFDEGDLNKDQIKTFIKVLQAMGDDETYGKKLITRRRDNPIRQVIETLRRLDVRPWDRTLQRKDTIGNDGATEGKQSYSGKGYGYPSRTPIEYIEDQLEELLKVASLVGVNASTGQTMTIRDYETALAQAGTPEEERSIREQRDAAQVLIKGIEAENGMLAYVQQAMEDIIVQAPEVLHNAKMNDSEMYKNVSEEDLAYNSIYILLNELFANYFPNLTDSLGTEYQGIDWDTHISEQTPKEIITRDRPKEDSEGVVGQRLDLARVGFFRKYARPFAEDGESGLHMNHEWERIIPKYDHEQVTAKDFTYTTYDLVNGKSLVVMDAANNPITYGIYDDESGMWNLYSDNAVEFKEDGELLPQGDPLFSVSWAVLDRNFVKGHPSDVQSDGSHTVLNGDKDSLTEGSSILNETGRIPLTTEVLAAHFGNKLSKAWRGQLANIEGLSIEDIEKYFSENVANWDVLNRPHALYPRDIVRGDGQVYRRDNLTPFKDWWTGEKERQANEENGVNPVTNKPYAWNVIETFKGHEGTKTRIKNNYPYLYDHLFTSEGLLKIDQDGNHEQLESLHKFFTDHGLQGIEIEEKATKTQLKNVVVALLNASDNILQGTPPEGLSEEASANFQQFAMDNEWDISETQLGSTPSTIAPEVLQDDPVPAGATTPESQVVSEDQTDVEGPTPLPVTGEPLRDLNFLEDGDIDALANIRIAKPQLAKFIAMLPENAQKHAIDLTVGGTKNAYNDEYFIVRDGKYNTKFLGMDTNKSLDEATKTTLLNHFFQAMQDLSEDINLTSKDVDKLGDIVNLGDKAFRGKDVDHPLYGKDIIAIGSNMDKKGDSKIDAALGGTPPPINESPKIIPGGSDDPPINQDREDKIKRIMGKKFGDFQYQDEKGKQLPAEDTEVWHYLAHIQEMSDEELKGEYKKEYINKLSGEKQGGMSQSQRTQVIADIQNIMLDTHKLANPTGTPLELDTAYLEGLTDEKLREQKAKRAETLHGHRQAAAYGRLELEANHTADFEKLFTTVMASPNKDNIMHLARELRIHRKKYDNSVPIEMNPTGKVSKPWVKADTVKALYEGPESFYGQISQVINPTTGQPYLNEAELDAQEQAIQQMVTNEDGIVDGQKLIEALDSLKTHFANKVKTDLENGSKFLQFLEDGQFNYAQREDSLANKIFSELATKHGNANYEYDDVTKMFHRSIFSEDGISTQSHIVDGASTDTIFDPQSIPWDQAPSIYNPDSHELESASYWNGMWVNPYVLETVLNQIQGEGDLFLRNPEILNLAREKYNIREDVSDETLRVIIPMEGENIRPILISQSGSLFPLPSNDSILTAEDGEQTTDTLIAYALSHALGLTLDSSDIERDSNGEMAPAILVTQMDEQGRIVHIPWDQFTGTILGQEPDEEAVEAATEQRELSSIFDEGAAGRFLARLRNQPDKAVEDPEFRSDALQQLYESNKIPMLRGIVNFIDDIKGTPNTHMWRQAHNMTIVQEMEQKATAEQMRDSIGLTEETDEQKKLKESEALRESAEEKFRAKLIGTEYSRLRSEGVPSDEAWTQAGEIVENNLTQPAKPEVEEVYTGTTPFDVQSGTPPPIVPDPQASPDEEMGVPEAEETQINTSPIDPTADLPPFLEGRETKKSAVGSLQEFLSS